MRVGSIHHILNPKNARLRFRNHTCEQFADPLSRRTLGSSIVRLREDLSVLFPESKTLPIIRNASRFHQTIPSERNNGKVTQLVGILLGNVIVKYVPQYRNLAVLVLIGVRNDAL